MCSLVYVPSEFHLSKEDEKAEYDKHENNPNDPGYLKFLSRLSDPLLVRLSKHRVGLNGLDFGCGPGPALESIFSEKGHKLNLYDFYYHPGLDVLDEKYDFIISTEVIEHLGEPSKIIELWLSLLNLDGTIGLMTKLVKDQAAFRNWHYKNDPTHICFYSRETFEWISKEYQVTYEVIGDDVIILETGY